MAQRAKKNTSKRGVKKPPKLPMKQRLKRLIILSLICMVGAILFAILSLRWLPVPFTPLMLSEQRMLGQIEYEWVSIDEMAPEILFAVVAAEDVNFCSHWGFDVSAIRDAIEQGGERGASTITQQVVKNVFLWQGRSWLRKFLEASLTPLVEIFWSKRRILEIYLNIAEFDLGVFGVEAASLNYFGIPSRSVSAQEAALLAAILPAPKTRSASDPSKFVINRGTSIMDGAALIQQDHRSQCFKD